MTNLYTVRLSQGGSFLYRRRNGQIMTVPTLALGILVSGPCAAKIVYELRQLGYHEAHIADFSGRPIMAENPEPDAGVEQEFSDVWEPEAVTK